MKVIALSVKAGKMTGDTLKKAMQEYLNKLSHPTGEQTVAQLMKQNQGLTNIEVTDGNIKSFEKTAKKYGIDFALKKDASQSPPKYM
ncbi:MAG: PcfB family protein, partial [Clostridia bacterium]|nr:PcfB family protein [Clostridia bacterium]